ncbi:IucA/IucC family siderophore biosynthesis protein [Erwiniaceae bacterium BAC15a-03b]|uniref:IucA/IucC family siderophore biosynthesis protein n=1 Tax=Winslowiella arboricola TaxID=2978220 RepID=A0A9J6PX28_9GAMM|nr:IucA/IucC family protein [Winslowiella arboricola]MCU5775318.1 IucA/IucC family siderophore biosynthesis protein [Winslowiella arboricola]MCU5780285.1 IucA/IucC family siderophore biosynthesis protein [Winslowiella arboricola]
MISQHQSTATDVAAQCFLNALLRETSPWQVVEPQHADQLPCLLIPLTDNTDLRIALRYFSLCGHHHYQFPAYLCPTGESQGEAIDFVTLVDALLQQPAIVGELPAESVARFRQRVTDSHRNTHEAIAARPAWRQLRDKALNFAAAEQALLCGHGFHPAPKSHEPFDTEQARRYLPDFSARFPLRWFAVARQNIGGDSLGLTLQQRLQRLVAESAPQLLSEVTENVWLLPMHPWQADRLLQQAWCQRLVASGAVRDLGEAGASWLPTSSSRSLYQENCTDMLKFSLSVRLTNSLRTLSLKEVRRGIRLARLAQTPQWLAWQTRYPTMRVMQEDGWAGLLDEQGNLQQESLLVLRVNLLQDRSQSQTNVLVALTQSAPDGGDSLLAAAVRRLSARLAITARQAARCWLAAYCHHVLVPLFSAEAELGMVLLAHQQNILLEMQQDLPVGLIYRDCQGSAFSRIAQPWLETLGEGEAENRFSEQQLLRYFPYYLLINSTLAVIASLAAAGLATEESLMAQVRDALTRLRHTVPDTTCLDYVLNNLYWQCKGNFFCCLDDHNENTIADPAVIYFDFANPLYIGGY